MHKFLRLYLILQKYLVEGRWFCFYMCSGRLVKCDCMKSTLTSEKFYKWEILFWFWLIPFEKNVGVMPCLAVRVCELAYLQYAYRRIQLYANGLWTCRRSFKCQLKIQMGLRITLWHFE